MIKFFRKIRQNLLTENKFSKYLLYAIGEIVLVVIGILIALSINNWNEYRKLRIKEGKLLHQLKDEFKANLSQLDDKIELRKEVLYSSSKLLSHIDHEFELGSDSLEHHLYRTLFVATFNAIHDDILSSNNLSLIQNDSLRIQLTHWPSNVEQLVEEELELLKYRQTDYIPFVTEHYPIRNLYHAIQKDFDITESISLGERNFGSFLIGNSKRPHRSTDLLGQIEFENHLGFVMMFNDIANAQSYGLRENIVQILDRIELELEHR